MPGPVTLNAPSYRPTLVGSHLQGNSLLASLSGKAGVVSVTADPTTQTELGQSNPTQPVRQGGTEPRAKRDLAQFAQALATANTPAQLLAHPVALLVLLTSHGLADQVSNGALATRALLSNPARSNSLLNQLKDPRWFAVNNRYSFATQGLARLRNPETIAAISRCYAAATGLDQTPDVLPFPPGAVSPETTSSPEN